jgi:hypothetical protein
MLLAPNEAYLFFKLMLPLQFFVNEKLGVLKNVKALEAYNKIPLQEKLKVRNALFENPHLIDEFIDEDPADIPMKELAIVSKWKRFIKGEFYIERYLKNHSILIGEDGRIYGVISLTEPLEAFVPKFFLPQLVQTVLLPFQDKIVHDGFLEPYRLSFGGNIKRELKDLYNKAKKQNKIITAF